MKHFNRTVTVLVFIFLYIPMIVLAVASFNTGTDIASFKGFTLRQYANLFRDGTLLTLLRNSVIIALLATLISTIVGTMAAVGIHSMKGRMRKAVMTLTNIPMTNPDIVTGVALALLFNLIYYRRKIVFGKLIYPYIAVSAALIIGGVGVISADDYFEPIGLYYTLGLGLGQFVLYLIFRSRLENECSYDRVERVARILYTGGLLFVVVVLGFYIQNLDKFIEKGGVLFFKQRNFVTSVFLMVIPMICILVRRSNLYLIGTVLMYIAMIMTGSRSGLLFGSFLLLVCLAYIYIKNKKHRRFYNWLFGVSIVVIAVLAIALLPQLYAARIENAAVGDKTRLEFIKLGVENFLAHPIFGIGIANMKDVGIFKAYVPGSLMFYHNAVIQIISSMGLVGVLAYGWMLFSRLKMLWIGRRRKRIAVFALSYIGIGLMSMTNPGIFCPFPEAGLLTLMFAIVEKEEEKYKMEEEK
mgnify:CR=1 FL=1